LAKLKRNRNGEEQVRPGQSGDDGKQSAYQQQNDCENNLWHGHGSGPFQSVGDPAQLSRDTAACDTARLLLSYQFFKALLEGFSALGIGAVRHSPLDHSRASAPANLQPSFFG
jgi:hypothetical protein